MPGECAPARSLCVGDQKLFNFDLELHSGLFYVCGSPDSVWTCQCLASISSKLDIARGLISKMAGDKFGQAANSSMRKNGCLGDVLRQDHCER